jgi:DNA replication protein DnaC
VARRQEQQPSPRHESLSIRELTDGSKWGEIFEDDMGATAMIDRRIHHSEILSLTGTATG